MVGFFGSFRSLCRRFGYRFFLSVRSSPRSLTSTLTPNAVTGSSERRERSEKRKAWGEDGRNELGKGFVCSAMSLRFRLTFSSLARRYALRSFSPRSVLRPFPCRSCLRRDGKEVMSDPKEAWVSDTKNRRTVPSISPPYRFPFVSPYALSSSCHSTFCSVPFRRDERSEGGSEVTSDRVSGERNRHGERDERWTGVTDGDWMTWSEAAWTERSEDARHSISTSWTRLVSSHYVRHAGRGVGGGERT